MHAIRWNATTQEWEEGAWDPAILTPGTHAATPAAACKGGCIVDIHPLVLALGTGGRSRDSGEDDHGGKDAQLHVVAASDLSGADGLVLRARYRGRAVGLTVSPVVNEDEGDKEQAAVQLSGMAVQQTWLQVSLDLKPFFAGPQDDAIGAGLLMLEVRQGST